VYWQAKEIEALEDLVPLYRNKDTGIVSWGPLLRANADKFAVCRTDVDLKVGFCETARKGAVFPALPLSVLVSVSVMLDSRVIIGIQDKWRNMKKHAMKGAGIDWRGSPLPSSGDSLSGAGASGGGAGIVLLCQ